MGWFTNAMKDLASRKGASKLKTTVKRQTEEGTVSVTVKGAVCVSVDELKASAREVGITIAAKGGSFQAGEGTQGGTVTGKDAAEFAENICDPDSYQWDEDEETEVKPRKRGKAADTIVPVPSENGTV